MWLIILVGVLALAFYFLGVKPYQYWEERGVSYVKPVPFIGNIGSHLIHKKAFAHLQEDLYSAFPDKRYVGAYQFLKPIIFIRDPKLIQTITVREFETFPEHRTFVPENVDPLWSKGLFALKGGKRWHDMRTTLSPSFTISKLKMMFNLMKVCATQFSSHFEKESDTIVIEMKETFTKLTNDIIATTAFGVNCNSFENPENTFYVIGKDEFDFTGIKAIKFVLASISPGLMKLFKIGIFSKVASDFFRGVIKESLRVRQQNNIVRPDMVHLLMEARKKQQKIEITDEDITAQAVIFYLGGFDSSSTFLCFTVYELAVNLDVQNRLRNEIQTALSDCKGELTYEALLTMKYLDMVLSESLRKWPPILTVDRLSTKQFTVESEQPCEKNVTLESGTGVIIPIYSLHRDPKHFPEPEKFDPERFNEDNKQNITPFTYIPFGAGPRNCIAPRFAMLEAKLVITEILNKFEIVPVERTQIPVQLDKTNFNILPENGLWLGLKPLRIAS